MSAEATESDDADGDEPPEIETDEKADIDLGDLDVDPDAVEEEAGAGAADDGDTDNVDANEQTPDMDIPDGATWGDQYVEMLALLLGEIAEQTDGEPGKTAEDIEALARGPPLALDEQVDEWLAQSGMGQDVPPGKALAVGTAGIVLVVLLTETDMAQDAVSNLTDQLGDMNL
jgi:hypothetical protein